MGITEPVEDTTDDIVDDEEYALMYYDEEEYLLSDPSAFTEWLHEIELDAEEKVAANDNGDRDNLMHSRSFAKHFMHLCQTVLLWSGICCNLFKSSNVTASSANVESAFKDIKKTLQDKIPTSVDSFVEKHLDMIAGEVKKASQKYITFVGDRPADTSSLAHTIARTSKTIDCIACKN